MFSWAFLDQRLTFNSFFFSWKVSTNMRLSCCFFLFCLRWFLIQFDKHQFFSHCPC